MIEGVYNKDAIKEPKYYFKLEDWHSNNVMLKIVDEDGQDIDRPYICKINKTTGLIHKVSGVNNTIGLDLDEHRYVKVE